MTPRPSLALRSLLAGAPQAQAHHPWVPGSEQHAFLQAVLLSEDAQSAEWIIAAQHYPAYSEWWEEQGILQLGHQGGGDSVNAFTLERALS